MLKFDFVDLGVLESKLFMSNDVRFLGIGLHLFKTATLFLPGDMYNLAFSNRALLDGVFIVI